MPRRGDGPVQPQRRIFDGQEFYSVTAAAQVLNRSPRTLRRLEAEGIIPRPRHELPGSKPGQRWYSQTDLEQLQKLVEESGFGERRFAGKSRLKSLVDSLAAEARTTKGRSDWAGEEVSRKPRQFLRRGLDDDERDGEWVPPSERREIEQRRAEPVPPPVCCPRCKTELIWVIQDVPGGGMAQVPVCEIHGPVDLSPPPAPDPTECPECGHRELVWQLDDPHQGFVPVCERCGPVQLPQPKADPRRERPFIHEVAFGTGLGQVAAARPRGLALGDVRGAIRASRPQPPARSGSILLPPLGATRPS